MSWIQTYTGKVFHVLDPRLESIDIDDIAHSLGMICRFNGHTDRFYSVAEHCVVVSEMVPERVAFEALMHDAHEAYVSDLARPIKWTKNMSGFRDIEKMVDFFVRRRFGMELDIPVEVDEADTRMLATEKKQLLAPCGEPWAALDGVEPFDLQLSCWGPATAKRIFLDRFHELYTEKRRAA